VIPDLQPLWDELDAAEPYQRRFWHEGKGWVLVSDSKPIIERFILRVVAALETEE
jgi:hypothetical protein